MKSFLLTFLFIISAFFAFSQSTFYGTFSVGYPIMEHRVNTMSMNLNADVDNIEMNPIVTIGVGKKFPSEGFMIPNFVADVTFLTGTADYEDNHTWMIRSKGILEYRFVRIKLNPNLHFRITDAISIDAGTLITFNLPFHNVEGTKTTYGYYDSIGHNYNPPIVEEITSTQLQIPILNGGLSTSLNYIINEKIEVFGRYTFDRNLTDADFMKVQTFTLGLNYAFKIKNK